MTAMTAVREQFSREGGLRYLRLLLLALACACSHSDDHPAPFDPVVEFTRSEWTGQVVIDHTGQRCDWQYLDMNAGSGVLVLWTTPFATFYDAWIADDSSLEADRVFMWGQEAPDDNGRFGRMSFEATLEFETVDHVYGRIRFAEDFPGSLPVTISQGQWSGDRT